MVFSRTPAVMEGTPWYSRRFLAAALYSRGFDSPARLQLGLFVTHAVMLTSSLLLLLLLLSVALLFMVLVLVLLLFLMLSIVV